MKKKPTAKRKNLVTLPIIWMLKLYKLILSPFTGECCRFYPSCSDYSVEAFETYGLIKGFVLSVKRICKCHPLHEGGIDLIPPYNQSK